MSRSRLKQFGLRLGRKLSPIAIHGITTVVVILFMALAHATLELTMGHDAKMYGAIPLQYFIDTIDLAILVRFAIKAGREFR